MKTTKAHATLRLALAIGQAMEAAHAIQDGSPNPSTPAVRIGHAIDLAKGLKRHQHSQIILAWLDRALEDARQIRTSNSRNNNLVHVGGTQTCLAAAFEHLLE